MGRILAGEVLRAEDFPSCPDGNVGEISEPDTINGDERAQGQVAAGGMEVVTID